MVYNSNSKVTSAHGQEGQTMCASHILFSLFNNVWI